MAQAAQQLNAARAMAGAPSRGLPSLPCSLPRNVTLIAKQSRGMKALTPLAIASGPPDGKDSSRGVAGTSLLLLLTTLLSDNGAARAISKQDVNDAYTQAELLSTQVTTTAGSAIEAARSLFDKVVTTLKPGLDAAAPYVKQTTESVTKAAAPLASDLAGEAQKALKNAGVDPQPGVEFAKGAAQQTSKVLEGAQPLGTSIVRSALSAGPVLLAEAAGGLVLLYFLGPPLLSTIARLTRGYSGDLAAAQALDLLLKLDCWLIDVRTEKEKGRSGVPSLPSSARSRYLAVPVEEFSGKIKFQLRNARRVEAEVAAIKIAALKGLNRGSRVVILDEYGNVAKAVARGIRRQGFKNCFAVTDGFKGGRGWVQSRLATEDAAVSLGTSLVEVLSPSRIIPAGSKKLGTKRPGTKRLGTSSPSGSSPFKMLPGGVDD